MLRRAWFAGLAALNIPGLVQEFVHDSRTDLINYTGTWQLVPVSPGDPYRNADVTLPVGLSTDAYVELVFTSEGLADEFIAAYGFADSNSGFVCYLNGVTLPASQGAFWQHGSLFDSPFFSVQPRKGINVVQIRRPPNTTPGADASSARVYFDGFGMALRGGPLPARTTAATAAYSVYPLWSNRIDDHDPFFTFEGVWYDQSSSDWPGGQYANTATLSNIVHPSDPVTQVTTGIMTFTGTPDEGFIWRGSSERSGPVWFYIQALDQADTSWQYVATVGTGANIYRYNGGDIAPGVQGSSYYENGYSESYYSQLQNAMTGYVGLPAGRYRFRLFKPANVEDGAGYIGDRATVIDSGSYLTRVPAPLTAPLTIGPLVENTYDDRDPYLTYYPLGQWGQFYHNAFYAGTLMYLEATGNNDLYGGVRFDFATTGAADEGFDIFALVEGAANDLNTELYANGKLIGQTNVPCGGPLGSPPIYSIRCGQNGFPAVAGRYAIWLRRSSVPTSGHRLYFDYLKTYTRAT